MSIPFLLGIQTQKDLGFNSYLRQGNGSHLQINKWNTNVAIELSSHLWLKFEPVNSDPDLNFNWHPLNKKAIEPSITESNYAFPNNISDFLRCVMIASFNDNYPILPWKRNDWTSTLNGQDIKNSHRKLRHPEPTALLQLFRQQRGKKSFPRALQNQIEEHNCNDCQENTQLPRVPRITMPSKTTSNIAVTLDVMKHLL